MLRRGRPAPRQLGTDQREILHGCVDSIVVHAALKVILCGQLGGRASAVGLM